MYGEARTVGLSEKIPSPVAAVTLSTDILTHYHDSLHVWVCGVGLSVLTSVLVTDVVSR